MSDPQTAIAPDALFVVACPVCLGQVAALGSLRGRDACCPLCASLFHVPDPSVAAVPAPAPAPAADAAPTAALPAPAADASTAQPGPEPVGMAEDWGGVITQLAPAPQDPEPAPTSTIDLADFDVHDEPIAAPAGDQDITTTPADAAGGDADEPAEVVGITSAAPAAPPRRAAPRQAAPRTAGDQMPVVGGSPLDPQASELAFSEPVRTIRHGDTVIEIRRLTPEERRARRFRRNVLMIVVGVSILLATYLLLSGR